jgi:integrase
VYGVLREFDGYVQDLQKICRQERDAKARLPASVSQIHRYLIKLMPNTPKVSTAMSAWRTLAPTKRPIPRPQSTNADAKAQLTSLLEASGPEDRLVWEFFLASWCRKQEVMCICWSDIDFIKK